MGFPLRGWVVTGILTLSSAGAFAADSKVSFPPCTTAPTDADRKAAQGAFAAGQGSFNEADYATAITYWRDAYRRDCTAHALLLNLARAYELKGDRAEAIASLETYLQRKPDAPDADQIKRRIENLKAQQASAAPQPTATATAPMPTSTGTGAMPPPPPPETGHSKGRSILPLVLLGGGGAVVGVVGAVMLSGGAAKVSEAEDECSKFSTSGSTRNCDVKAHPQLQASIDKGNEGRSQETLGGVLIGVGVAAIGTGVILYLTSAPSGSAQGPSGVTVAKNTQLTPAVSPSFAGFSLAGHF
jgi:tetratricopeptide (TPR) repeat protein